MCHLYHQSCFLHKINLWTDLCTINKSLSGVLFMEVEYSEVWFYTSCEHDVLRWNEAWVYVQQIVLSIMIDTVRMWREVHFSFSTSTFKWLGFRKWYNERQITKWEEVRVILIMYQSKIIFSSTRLNSSYCSGNVLKITPCK